MRRLFVPFLLLFSAFQALSQSQYASSVIAFSTQWSTGSWSASQTLSAPNTVGCGDITTSWASSSADGVREFLVLGYTTPQPVNKINIYETWNPGAVDTIYLRNSSNGQWNIVYTNTAASALPCPRTNTINITQTLYNVDAIRLAINSPAVPSWNEIDAVEIQNNCSTSITTTNNPLACFGNCNATATALPTGQSPFTYSWSTSPSQSSAIATGLCSGTYSVFVTDANSCISTASITISDPVGGPITCSIGVITPSTCGNANGSACIGVSGGTGGYTYSWIPSPGTSACISNVVSGSYTLYVTDANGCTSSISVNIPNTPGPTVVITNVVNVTCNGNCNGSAVAQITGGTAPYTVQWTPNGPNNLCAGTYTVMVTDANGCIATDQVNITQPPALQLIISDFQELCTGDCNGSLSASVSGGCPGYSYTWSPNGATTPTATGLCTGIYTLIITDQCGCSISQSPVLPGPQPLQTNTTSVNLSCSTCCDGSASTNTTGGVNPYFWTWSPGNMTGMSVSNLCVGTYTVCVTDMNGCTTCDTISIMFTVGQNELISENDVVIAPNPSSGQFQVTFTNEKTRAEKIEVYDAIGKIVRVTSDLKIDISEQPKGIYLLKVYTNKGILERKIVLQ
jgi:hypothetical protein